MAERRNGKRYDLITLRGDVFGGITAAVIGLPVALAFGIASGLGAIAGIYGAIAVGFFAAVFGGTRGQISGPTGLMLVAMTVIVSAHADNLVEAFTIVIMAGLIQVLIGVLRIGRYVAYTPYSVISGFMSGVGIIIIIVQILPFVGAEIVTGGPRDVMAAIPDMLSGFNPNALSIATVTLAVAVLWPTRLSKYLPSTLTALAVGTAIGVLWLTDTSTIGDVPTGLPEIQLPLISLDVLLSAVQPALVIALVSSVDSLLTSLVADSGTRSQHNPNRELIGQGMGNMVAGFIGGLPGAGTTPATVANIRVGGRTALAGVLCVVILTAIVLGLGSYVSEIPNAVLAGILIKVGWDTIDWRFITRMHHVQREHLLVMLITLILTVFLDVITAVAVGIITAAVTSARQIERLEVDSVVSVPLLDQIFFRDALDPSDVDEAFSARVGLVQLKGTFSVASASKLMSTIGDDIKDHEVVILDFNDTVYMDDSAALVIERLVDIAKMESTECIILALDGLPATTLNALSILRDIPEDRFVDTLDEAREMAWRLLAGNERHPSE